MLKSHQIRVLFLDFDGVLHRPKAIAGAKPPLTPRQIRSGWPETFEHLPILKALLEGHSDVAVVVSSSWRLYLKDEQLAELLDPISSWFHGSIKRSNRDEGIKEWLVQHQMHDYAILDDVVRFFPGEWPSLILCNPALGLSDSMVQDKLQRWLNEGKAGRDFI